VLVAVVTVDAIEVVVIQALLYLLPQHGGSHQILSRWQPATTEIYSLLSCNSAYLLEYGLRYCGSSTAAGTPRIVYRYATLIKYPGIRKTIQYKPHIQGDQKVSVHLLITVQKHAKMF
jgi:hypothetical protein